MPSIVRRVQAPGDEVAPIVEPKPTDPLPGLPVKDYCRLLPFLRRSPSSRRAVTLAHPLIIPCTTLGQRLAVSHCIAKVDGLVQHEVACCAVCYTGESVRRRSTTSHSAASRLGATLVPMTMP